MAIKFDPTLNVSNTIAAILFVAAGVGAWRSMETRLLANEATQKQSVVVMESRMDAFEENQRNMIMELKSVALNQMKVATLLDAHIQMMQQTKGTP